MAKVFKIDGLDDCIKCMDQAPANVLNMTKTAMKDAGKATARIIRSGTPGRFRPLVGYKVTKGQISGNMYALVGYFNKGKKKTSQSEISDWFKAYWKNYGTLARRDASHHFANGVKPANRRRRNNLGQPAVNFFEGAIQGWDTKFLETFRSSMASQEDKLYDR
jgi:hypothetical protein